MRKVIILTGNETRHAFFRKYLGLSPGIEVLNSYCESALPQEKLLSTGENKSLRIRHLASRTQSEQDFFGLFVEKCADKSNPIFIPRGDINSAPIVSAITESNPEYVIAYGCSIIKPELIQKFSGRFINLHLGLSPYYRGSGTNFWPLVNQEPELVGATFMHIDEGIDTGEIIHQIRSRIVPFDTVHSIGNRLIKDAAKVMAQIIREGFEKKGNQEAESKFVGEKVYKNRDFNEAAVEALYRNFEMGMIDSFLDAQEELESRRPIFQQARYFTDF